jgi:hypothetical protein
VTDIVNLIVIEALVETRLGKKLDELGSSLSIWSDTLILDIGYEEIHITKMVNNYMTTREVIQLAIIILGELEHKLV